MDQVALVFSIAHHIVVHTSVSWSTGSIIFQLLSLVLNYYRFILFLEVIKIFATMI